MNEEKAQYQDDPNTTKREKYWNELSVEEKIDRMRWVFNQRHEMMQRQLKRIERQLKRLESHEHNARGAIVIPLETRFGPFDYASDAPDKPDPSGGVFF